MLMSVLMPQTTAIMEPLGTRQAEETDWLHGVGWIVGKESHAL